jgi:tetratricopeptide (TPR) repeat protein
MIIYPAIIIVLLFIIFFIVWRRAYLTDNPDTVFSLPKINLPTMNFRHTKETVTGKTDQAKPDGKFEGFWGQADVEEAEMKEAEDSLEKTVKKPTKEPPPANSPMDRAEDLFRKKQFISAEKWYIEAAKNDPKNSKIYSRLAVIYLENNNLKDAQESLEESIKLDPNVASRYFNLSYVYYSQSKFKEASDSARKALRLDGENPKYKAWIERLRNERL